jgi:hypothetical protein
MNSEEPIRRDDKLYASCKTCGEVASWVPHKAGDEWECQACRTGTRQYGRADREKYLRDKMSPKERRLGYILTIVRILAITFGAFLIWELLRFLISA